MNLQAQTYRGFRWTALSSGFRLLLQIIQLIILSRFLGPVEFGLLAIVQVVINFTQIFLDLGISNALIHKQHTESRVLSSLYWLNVMTGFLLFYMVFIFSQVVAGFYGHPVLTWLLIQSAVSFLILPFGQQYMVLLQKELNFRYLAITESCAALSGLIVTIVFLFLRQGLYSIIYGTIFSSLFLTVSYVLKGRKIHRPEFVFDFSGVKSFISFGLFQMGEKSITYFSSSLDKLFIGKVYGEAILGFYSIAYQLLYYPMRLINPVIGRVALPVFARMQENKPLLNETYIHNISLITLFTFPLYTGLFAVCGDLIPVLMGNEWERSAEIFRMICILGIFRSMGNPLGAYLYAQGRADAGFYFNIFHLLVNFTALYVGSFLGFNYMLFIFVTANIVFLVPADYTLRWYLTRMPVIKYIKAFLPNFLAAVIMMAVVFGVARLLENSPVLIRLVVCIIAGIVAYGGYVFSRYRALRGPQGPASAEPRDPGLPAIENDLL